MVKLLIFLILLAPFVMSQQWVSDFNNCPNNYAAQNCLVPGELVCGYDTGTSTLECSDPSEIIAPASLESSNNGDTYESSLAGGFIIDCIDYDGTDPHCSNGNGNIYWCNRNNTCRGTLFRQTVCSAGVFANSSCGVCRTDNGGYFDCDADGGVCEVRTSATCDDNAQFNGCNGAVGQCDCNTNFKDCDDSDGDADEDTGAPDGVGNGCEIQLFSANATHEEYTSCTTSSCESGYNDCNATAGCETQNGTDCFSGGVSGTWSTCTCVPAAEDFTTGEFEQFLIDIVDGAMLWFKNFGTGWLINATNANDETWGVNAEACMVLKDGHTICDQSDLNAIEVEEQNSINLTGGGRIYGQTGGDVIFRLG